MDKDKLIKLIKLANNNPNENEANLAARKVCKLLADNNFAALNAAPMKDPTNLNAQTVRDMWADVMRYSSPTGKYTSGRYTSNSSNYNYTRKSKSSWGPDYVDQRDEPAPDASKEEWEDFYKRRRREREEAKGKYAGHAYCSTCYQYVKHFDPVKAEWRCPCGKTIQPEVDRARQASYR